MHGRLAGRCVKSLAFTPEALDWHVLTACCSLLAVHAFPDFCDHLLVEGRQVAGVAAGNQALVGDHLLVYPLGAGIAEVG